MSKLFDDTPELARRRLAKMGVERIIRDQVRDEHPDAFHDRPIYPGADERMGLRRVPLPLEGLAAARQVMFQAQAVEVEAIANARGAGNTWAKIGETLGKTFVAKAEKADMPLAEAAWRYAAYRIEPDEEVPWTLGGREPYAYWRCWSCTGSIYEGAADYGVDAEKGHAVGCPRAAKRRRAGHRWT